MEDRRHVFWFVGAVAGLSLFLAYTTPSVSGAPIFLVGVQFSIVFLMGHWNPPPPAEAVPEGDSEEGMGQRPLPPDERQHVYVGMLALPLLWFGVTLEHPLSFFLIILAVACLVILVRHQNRLGWW